MIGLVLIAEDGKLEIEAVTLPEALTAKADNRRYDLIVNVMRDGTYRVHGRTRSSEELAAVLMRRSAAAGGRVPLVKIRCDADAPYKYVQTVMEHCKGAGVHEVSFGVAQRHESL
jgi:biopolymer transport protein ExbD